MRPTEASVDEMVRQVAREQSAAKGELVIVWHASSHACSWWQVLRCDEEPTDEGCSPELIVGYQAGHLAVVRATEEEREHASGSGYDVGTCDWGACDEPTYAYRLSHEDESGQWLSVCREHAVEPKPWA